MKNVDKNKTLISDQALTFILLMLTVIVAFPLANIIPWGAKLNQIASISLFVLILAVGLWKLKRDKIAQKRLDNILAALQHNGFSIDEYYNIQKIENSTEFNNIKVVDSNMPGAIFHNNTMHTGTPPELPERFRNQGNNENRSN